MEPDYGFIENPINGNGIIRSRTVFGQLRSWQIPRTQTALEQLNKEFGETEFPGVYVLFHKTKKEVYVGEAKSIYIRLKTHMKTPEDKIRDWSNALVINDGRIATQSDFNDTVIRKSMEMHLIRLFKVNKYRVLSQGASQQYNPQQQSIANRLTGELNFLLQRQRIISKLLQKKEEEVVHSDDLYKILKQSGLTIDVRGEREAVISGRKAFIRRGSKKKKGWQVTIRGKKLGSFIDALQKGEGDLVVPRNGVLRIPLNEIKEIIPEESFEKDTIDVYITFGEKEIKLQYKAKVLDVTRFRVQK